MKHAKPSEAEERIGRHARREPDDGLSSEVSGLHAHKPEPESEPELEAGREAESGFAQEPAPTVDLESATEADVADALPGAGSDEAAVPDDAEAEGEPGEPVDAEPQGDGGRSAAAPEGGSAESAAVSEDGPEAHGDSEPEDGEQPSEEDDVPAGEPAGEDAEPEAPEPAFPDAAAPSDSPAGDSDAAGEAVKRPRHGKSFSLEDESAIGFGDLTEAEQRTVDKHQATLAELAAKAAAGKHAVSPGGESDGDAGEGSAGADADGDADRAEAAPGSPEQPKASALRRIALRANEKSGGRIYAHKWQIAAALAVVGIVVIGLPLGFAAGWGVASGGPSTATPATEEAPANVPTADQELRDANVAARYKELGFDPSEMDRMSADDIEPITVDPVAVQPANELQRLADVDVSAGTSIVMDVPIVNQLDTSNDGRYLMAGCEIASLSMLLRYAGVEVTKEELQDATPTVPMNDDNGLYGNPNKAFVGSMEGDYHGAGYSVYHAPIAELAQHYLLNQSFKVVDLTGQSFTVLLKELASGNPCWVITTTSMQPDMWPETWDTADGPMVVNWALHSVVVTGYDDESIYINDPYGYTQNVPYDRNGFEQAWKLMGSQAVAIVPTQ